MSQAIPLEFANALIGISGILLALGVYRLSRQQTTDSWLRTSGEIHSTFWDDDDIQEIRRCLAYPQAYEPLRAALERRQALNKPGNDEAELSSDEFELIDKLDKFLNLLARAAGDRLEIRWRRRLWKSLFFYFWLQKALDPEKPELYWYTNEFYKGLVRVAEDPRWQEDSE